MNKQILKERISSLKTKKQHIKFLLNSNFGSIPPKLDDNYTEELSRDRHNITRSIIELNNYYYDTEENRKAFESIVLYLKNYISKEKVINPNVSIGADGYKTGIIIKETKTYHIIKDLIDNINTVCSGVSIRSHYKKHEKIVIWSVSENLSLNLPVKSEKEFENFINSKTVVDKFNL